ncbi:MAG TPA: proline--tRNA ligase [Thermoflexales bacterium]|jgi:prolyl-tRNA synthetase|nr:proline--tRNA ligase [Thermoflexales bacterium]HQX09718.1 proline--tRNA ligase [Thermoflexales bacterium]HQY24053.1 proline--tRNA ligase [Thermoflexales bacterium]HQZ53057.1 proline--tRNA ligase [Thermoflexales bacterium]HRA52525.1 proline--tRNA ligase [Thermoflexales bacterium]
MAKITPRSEDFNQWYLDVLREADMFDYAPVRGCIVVKPYGWTLYENMRDLLDRRFKDTGHSNAAFPLLIPMSFLKREASHVEGFSPELAVVTHGGGEELEEPLVIRPTSETIIGHSYAQWVKSYRDLPILINLWNSVVRWEKRTKPFLRTMEFYWQEGHTAHATHEESWAEVTQMLDVYHTHGVEDCAVPSVKGRKSRNERFAGAINTLSVEAMMGDKRALQAGTSHDLGQNFARAFDIKFLDRDNTEKHCWTTSWGLSWRFMGGMIMIHGDDQGLRLPPRIAPIQAVIVPIYKSDDEKAKVMEAADRIRLTLKAAGIKVKLDDRDETPGFKFNDWEMRGVPVRVEVGPRDVANNSVALARRDIPGKAGKIFTPQEGLADKIKGLFDEIHASLLRQAEAFQKANIREANTWEELKAGVQEGWVLAPLLDDPAVDAKLKEELQVTNRNFPFDQAPGEWNCVVTGKPVTERALISRAY